MALVPIVLNVKRWHVGFGGFTNLSQASSSKKVTETVFDSCILT